jgi:competence protein ComEC
MVLVLGVAVSVLLGLLVGATGGGVPLAVAAIAAALGLSSRRLTSGWAGELPLPWLAVLVGVAALLGDVAQADASRCRARAAASRVFDGVVDLTPAAPGERAVVQVVFGHCEVRASVMVARGAAPAGARVRISGEVSPSPRGILVRNATVHPTGGASWRLVQRARAAAVLDTLFGVHAPMARALVVADTRDLDQALKDRFADSGLIHAISISGLHVAIIAQALGMLFGLLRAPPTVAAVGGLLATVGYVAMLGAPPPAVRAAVMLGIPMVAKVLQRPVSKWAAVAWGALLPLGLDPLTALDIGYQLSVGGMAGLICAGAWAKRVVPAHWEGWRGTIARELATGVAVAVLTAPLSAWHVGRLSLVAPVTNLLASPLLSALQPALFLTLACSPLDWAGRTAAAGTSVLLAGFDWIARAGAAVPHAALVVSPGVGAAIATGVAVTALGAACLAPSVARRGVIVGLGAVGWAVWAPLVVRRPMTELHVFDVGQGDALGIRTRRGRWVLIDAGPGGTAVDAARAVLLPALRRLGGPVDALVLTHPDLDHVGGAATLIRTFAPSVLLEPGFPGTSDAYRDALVAAKEAGTQWRAARAGDSLVVDEVTLRVLAPDSALVAEAGGPNDASVVVQAQIGAVRWLLTGDAEAAEERWLADRVGEALESDVYKVGHHGSATSSTEPLLTLARPRLAVVSVGARNRYGHPSRDVLSALARRGVIVLRTDRLGPLVVRTDGIRVEAEGGGERLEVPGRPAGK